MQRLTIYRLVAALGLTAMTSALSGCICVFNSGNDNCCDSDGDCKHVVKTTSPTTIAAFDRLKKLNGDWETTYEGKQVLAAQFRVTSNGSVLREVMFPDTPNEMINMYSIDGDCIAATHYCAMGNQPHMCCTDFSNENVFAFKFRSVSNLKDAKGEYMSDLRITITDADHCNESWGGMKAGEHSDHTSFDLTRKK